MNTSTNFFAPKGQFTGAIMISSVFKRKDLTLGAKNVFSLLVNYAQTGMEHCCPSQVYLTEYLGVSLRSVQNYIKELVNSGFIYIQRGQFGTSPKYYFIARVDLEQRSSAGKPAATTANLAHTPANLAPIKYNININKIPPLSPTEKMEPSALPSAPSSVASFGGGDVFSCEVERQFWTFFNAYPRKENPHAALRLWIKYGEQGAMPRLEKVLAAIEANKARNPVWQKESGRFVPYLVNWLRDCRWNDEFAENATTPQKSNLTEDELALCKAADNAAEKFRQGQLKQNLKQNQPKDNQATCTAPKLQTETEELSESDPDFERLWEVCPFERGPRIPAISLWRVMSQKQGMDVSRVNRLFSAVCEAKDYKRSFWQFLDEQKRLETWKR